MTASQLDPTLLSSLSFRCIGPPRGGRVVTVAGDPTDPAVAYFGAVAGGVWKTDDAGVTWRNISDGQLKTASVGALAVSESDPNVIYAGMGEATIRIDVSHGDGVYKSTDGGQNWRHLGLEDTRHIGKIVVHPRNPDVVYVAALGHAFGPNEERGVFRSTDGGQNWERVLFKSDQAGAVDLALDARNPDVVYATIWQTHRNFWEMSSGGPESGLWKSTDGGDTWREITRNKGLPQEGILGKIGVAASPAQAGRVWAVVESSQEPGFYRSDDFGESWRLLTDKQDLRYRPWYYCHVYADPQDADTVYVLNLSMWKSSDGGVNWQEIATPHGDNHGLWINPHNNRHLVQGNDGGACISFNGGETFTTIYNQLTAQFYRMAVDNQFPYRVYGTQQDNSSISVPSDTLSGAIAWSDCYAAGTGESGFIAVHPEDANIVYVGAVGSSPGGGGALQRYDHRTGQIQLVNVWPEAHGGIGPVELKYRFPWTFPILFSPHDANILYTCGNVVFRSSDEGHSWQPISPDLTRNDPEKLAPSGGPITKDTSGAEHYCTIATFRESPYEAGVFWSGSDDGLVYLSRDNGASWQNVTPADLPEWSYISTLEPSPHDPATVYLAATRYKLDDTRPYLFKSHDYGATWQAISDGLPAQDFTRVIRADPARAGLLYVGTETGLYLSLDDGASWQRWESNLPVVPVYDLAVKQQDLVVATHGRSFWIVDDLTLLHQAVDGFDAGQLRLFAPRRTHRVLPDLTASWAASEGRGYGIGISAVATFWAETDEIGRVKRTFLDTGEGGPRGLLLHYNLPQPIAAEAAYTLAFLTTGGDLIREFTPKPGGYDKLGDDEKAMVSGPWLPTAAGAHRFVWDLRYAGAERVLGDKTTGASASGPLVVPGEYVARLTVGDQTLETRFEVVNDPRIATPQADLEAQLALLLQLRDKISQTHQGIDRLRSVRSQVEAWRKRLRNDERVVQAADALLEKLASVEDALILPGEHKDTFGLNDRVRLNAALTSLLAVVNSADAKPTQQARQLAAETCARIDAQLTTLGRALDQDLSTLNDLIMASEVAPIGVEPV